MNTYGTSRSIVTQLVAGEPVKAKTVKAKIPRSSRHFSQMKGTEIGADGKRHNEGLAKYDLLALDAEPRLVKSGMALTSNGKHIANTESLLKDRVIVHAAKPVVTWQSFNGYRYTPSIAKLAEIRAINSTDHILNPTGGNVCGKCGYDKYCTCPKPVWAGGTPLKRTKPEPKPTPAPLTGIWLRDRGNGTYKVHAILA